MARFFFIAFSLLALASCKTDQPQEEASPSPGPSSKVTEKKPELNVALPTSITTKPQEDQSKPSGTAAKNRAPESVVQPQEKGRSKAAAIAARKAAQPVEKAEPSKLTTKATAIATPAAPNHETWNALLQKHVSSTGKVDYKGLLEDRAKLQAYLDELAANPPAKGWSRDARLAYWINAYNAFTVQLILEHYPVSSIMEIHDGKPWDVKWIKLGNSTYSLNNIENDIIRPRFGEPRIHFAVNCAAQSCPPILNRAWTADNLNRYLEQQARSFINNSHYNEISSRAVQISKIFEWYASDFGNLIDFLNKYSDTRIQPDAQVSYKEYDWSLNN